VEVGRHVLAAHLGMSVSFIAGMNAGSLDTLGPV
jgi:hypothetical protein